jgi:hypothetical protein
MNTQSDNITTASISSSNKNESKLKSIITLNEGNTNLNLSSIYKKKQVEFKALTSRFVQEQGLSLINFVKPADPLLKRTKFPKLKPKLGKLKSYM